VEDFGGLPVVSFVAKLVHLVVLFSSTRVGHKYRRFPCKNNQPRLFASNIYTLRMYDVITGALKFSQMREESLQSSPAYY